MNAGLIAFSEAGIKFQSAVLKRSLKSLHLNPINTLESHMLLLAHLNSLLATEPSAYVSCYDMFKCQLWKRSIGIMHAHTGLTRGLITCVGGCMSSI